MQARFALSVMAIVLVPSLSGCEMFVVHDSQQLVINSMRLIPSRPSEFEPHNRRKALPPSSRQEALELRLSPTDALVDEVVDGTNKYARFWPCTDKDRADKVDIRLEWDLSGIFTGEYSPYESLKRTNSRSEIEAGALPLIVYVRTVKSGANQQLNLRDGAFDICLRIRGREMFGRGYDSGLAIIPRSAINQTFLNAKLRTTP